MINIGFFFFLLLLLTYLNNLQCFQYFKIESLEKRVLFSSNVDNQIATRKNIRKLKAASILQRELSNIIHYAKFKTKDQLPNGLLSLVTIKNVDISGDLRYATIQFDVVGESFSKRKITSWLNENKRAIRYSLSKAIRHFKFIPDIKFKLQTFDKEVAIEELFDELRLERSQNSSESSDASDIELT